MINQSEIEAKAEKLKLETGINIIAVYNEHSEVQYYPASVKIAEGFEVLYVTKNKKDDE